MCARGLVWRETEIEDVGLCDICTVDFAAVAAVVDATHRYREIFYNEQ